MNDAGSYRIRKLLLLGMLLVFVCLVRPRGVDAHAEFIGADPSPGSALATAPSSLRLTFTEAVDPGLSSVSLLAADGNAVGLNITGVDPGDAHVLVAELDNPLSVEGGIYTVVWSAYSAEDDHTSSGSYTFSIGTGVSPDQDGITAGRVSSAAVLGKWLELVGVILLTGLAVFTATTSATVRIDAGRRLDATVVLSVVALAGALVSLWARVRSVGNGDVLGSIDRERAQSVLESTYGQAWAVRILALLGVVGLSLWLRRRNERYGAYGIAALGTMAIASIAVSGHAGSVDSARAAMAVDFMHMAGAAVWLGGLLGLLLVFDPPFGSPAYRSLVHALGKRFLAAIAVIVVAGVVSAWWHVGGRRELTRSDYGQTLLIKIAIVAAILGIAYYNRRVLQRPLGKADWSPFATGIELVLAMWVLLFSADLSLSPTANGPLAVEIAARAIEVDSTASDGESTVQLTGVLTGDPADTIWIDVSPVTDLQRLIVQTRLTDAASGVEIGDRFDAVPVEGESGRYQLSAGRLGVAGVWTLDVTVRRAGVEDDVVSIPIDTTALAERGTTSHTDIWGGVRPTAHTALALLLAIVMLLVGLGGIKRLTGLEPLASGFLLAASLLIAGGFLVSAARSVIPTTPDHGLANPMTADSATLTYAGELYRLNCAACHGSNGRGTGSGDLEHLHGDGADLTRRSTVEQSDGDLRYWIANGVPGSEMPAFSPALAEDEQWQLVSYLRELQAAAKAEDEAEQ